MKVKLDGNLQNYSNLRKTWICLVLLVFFGTFSFIVSEDPGRLSNSLVYIVCTFVSVVAGIFFYLIGLLFSWLISSLDQSEIKRMVWKFFYVGTVAMVVLLIYFITSPYQNCVREFNRLDRPNTIWCSENTKW